MDSHLTDTSRFLSYVLRHEPQSIGLQLDREGWADMATLIACAGAAGRELDEALIREVVESSDKKRFALSPDGTQIRAVQGHSTSAVAISYAPVEPPEVLYHGTATRFLSAIGEEGLKPGGRQYVHLSQDYVTAASVGARHGKPTVLCVDARQMFRQGYQFFQADNGVWLTARVPAGYLSPAGQD